MFTEPMEIDACKNKKINKTSFKVVRSNPSMGEGDLSTPTHIPIRGGHLVAIFNTPVTEIFNTPMMEILKKNKIEK